MVPGFDGATTVSQPKPNGAERAQAGLTNGQCSGVFSVSWGSDDYRLTHNPCRLRMHAPSPCRFNRQLEFTVAPNWDQELGLGSVY